MLNWIFKKPSVKAPAPVYTAPVSTTHGDVPERLLAPPKPPVASHIDWLPQLRAAQGNDAALLALALEQTPLQIKLEAVGALQTEATLRQAEREFRGQHRRVHQLAKQRYLAQVAQRECREEAVRLIAAAQALLREAVIPLNHAVELDRTWQALDASLLEPGQQEAYMALSTQLSVVAGMRADQEQQLKLWHRQAQQAVSQLQAAMHDAASGIQDRAHLGAAVVAARAVAEAAPEASAWPTLRIALETAVELDAHLAVLSKVLGEPGTTAAPSADEEPANPLQQWNGLAPLKDAVLTELLHQRFAHWQADQNNIRLQRQARRREHAKEKRQTASGVREEALVAALDGAEAALAEGNLHDVKCHCIEIDQLTGVEAPAEGLRGRIAYVQARWAELRGWQHWAGGRARDDLTAQAEALASATGTENKPSRLNLSITQRSELIDDLRAQWKELDRLGGASSRDLWQRFDAALKTAYEPIATHAAALRTAREQNLAAREQLLKGLQALLLPGSNDDTQDAGAAGAAPDLKAVAATLEQFKLEWRKLGPVEHTVPHKHRQALLRRLNEETSRLQAPLDAARNQGLRERERMVARAKSLSAGVAGGSSSASPADQVAEAQALQAEWRDHARAVPLGRAAENALWAEFKGAIDALFSARASAYQARDAEFKARSAERHKLIERLEALRDAVPSEVKRGLPEIEAQWRQSGPPLRADADTLEKRFRQAHDAVRQSLADSAQRDWLACCKALETKLLLCTEAEHSPGEASLQERWAAVAPLPQAWEQALGSRWRAGNHAGFETERTPTATATTTQGDADELLLQLEAAWSLASPPAFESARRELKLRAMKQALEGRKSTHPAASPEDIFIALLSHPKLTKFQQDRLAQLIAALRARGPRHGENGNISTLKAT